MKIKLLTTISNKL